MNIHLYSIDDFLDYARKKFHLNNGQIAGFRSMMIIHHHKYVSNPKTYLKPLKFYLNH